MDQWTSLQLDKNEHLSIYLLVAHDKRDNVCADCWIEKTTFFFVDAKCM